MPAPLAQTPENFAAHAPIPSARRRLRGEKQRRARAEATARDRRLAAGRELDAARRNERAAAARLQAAGPGDDVAWAVLARAYTLREHAEADFVAACPQAWPGGAA